MLYLQLMRKAGLWTAAVPRFIAHPGRHTYHYNLNVTRVSHKTQLITSVEQKKYRLMRTHTIRPITH